MVRPISRIIVFVMILFGFASLPTMAQSGRAFYIDSASGSNSNTGTSESAPWQSHPYMSHTAGCDSGTGPSYTHQAGDQFIFKGGVTWPASCFPMTISAGGSSNNSRDVYTVDQNWFSGGSWTRPVFAGQGVYKDAMVYIDASNVTMSNFDIGGQNLLPMGGSKCSSNTIVVDGNFAGNISNVTVTQSKLHDWIMTSSSANYNAHGRGGMCYTAYPTNTTANNIVLDNSEVRDDGNIASGSSKPVGACGESITIQYTHCHYLLEGIVSFGTIHDSEFDQLGDMSGSCSLVDCNAVHLNVIEADTYDGDGPVYNNYIHDDLTYGEVIFVECSSSIYNNVISNQGHFIIGIGTANDVGGSGESSCTGFVANNTIDVTTTTSPGTAVYCASYLSGVTVTGGNNICIVGGSAGGTVGAMNAYQMSTSEASTYGYVNSNKYSPSSSDPKTTSAGANLDGLCSGSLAALCADASGTPWFGGTTQPRGSGAWALGPFVFGATAASSNKPTAPSNLTAIID